MRTTKKLTAIIIALMFALPLFNGCKKGENDPMLTIKSRKSRLVGEWTISAYSKTSTDASGTETETFNGSMMTFTDASGSATCTGTWTLTIAKDGTYEMSQMLTFTGGSQIITDNGLWYFTGGGKESDTKSGELLCMQSTSYTGTSGSTTYVSNTTGIPSSGTIYKITQLKNKEVILTCSYTETNAMGSSSSTDIVTETMTLTQK